MKKSCSLPLSVDLEQLDGSTRTHTQKQTEVANLDSWRWRVCVCWQPAGLFVSCEGWVCVCVLDWVQQSGQAQKSSGPRLHSTVYHHDTPQAYMQSQVYAQFHISNVTILKVHRISTWIFCRSLRVPFSAKSDLCLKQRAHQSPDHCLTCQWKWRM